MLVILFHLTKLQVLIIWLLIIPKSFWWQLVLYSFKSFNLFEYNITDELEGWKPKDYFSLTEFFCSKSYMYSKRNTFVFLDRISVGSVLDVNFSLKKTILNGGKMVFEILLKPSFCICMWAFFSLFNHVLGFKNMFISVSVSSEDFTPFFICLTFWDIVWRKFEPFFDNEWRKCVISNGGKNENCLMPNSIFGMGHAIEVP